METITNYWDLLPDEIQIEIYRVNHKINLSAVLNELQDNFAIIPYDQIEEFLDHNSIDRFSDDQSCVVFSDRFVFYKAYNRHQSVLCEVYARASYIQSEDEPKLIQNWDLEEYPGPFHNILEHNNKFISPTRSDISDVISNTLYLLIKHG